MTWRLAEALNTLRAEINAAAPRRSIASDGTIGDPAHASRSSDHNPNAAGVVRAVDVTDDPANGCDAGAIAEAVRLLGLRGTHPALGPGAYVIFNRRIASATQDGAPWDWEPYSGSNAHTQHVHVSAATSAAGYDSTARWGVMEDSEMNENETRRIAREVAQQVVQRELDAALDDLPDAIKVDLGRDADWSLQRTVGFLVKRVTQQTEEIRELKQKIRAKS